ncbi:MAG: sialate O-acetylesterase [Thermoleophilia bacterium]
MSEWTAFVVVALLVIVALWSAAAAAATVPHLKLSSPCSYQVFQRNAVSRGAIRVTATAVGVSGQVEASWRGGAWVIVSRISHGGFAGWLYGQPAGQGTLSVRSVSHPQVQTFCRLVGVGDIFVIAGQSNACGEAKVLFSYSNPTVMASEFATDYRWQKLTDPTDSNVGQVDKVNRNSAPGGSVWPLVATALAAKLGNHVPLAFVPCALGGTVIAQWQRSNTDPDDATTLYGAMIKRVRALGGHVRAVLFWQGETDALADTAQATYTILSSRFDANVWRDLQVPIVVGQIGDYNDDQPRPGADNVRLAQEDLWTDGSPIVLPGPCLYDIDLYGSNHFLTAPQNTLAAQRWTAAIENGVYHDGDGEGPVLATATYNGGLDVVLTFTGEALPLAPVGEQLGGFTVSQDGTAVELTSATISAANEVTLELAQPASGPLTVSLGSGRSAAGAIVPTDSSPAHLPAWPFVNAPVLAE